MGEAFAPFAASTAIWWLSTGILFWLVGRPKGWYGPIALGSTALMVFATLGLLALRGETGPMAAYLGFAAGIGIWAWHEALFLLGYVAGPQRTPCPQGLSLWPRFVASTKAVIHHELLIAGHAVLLVALSWGADNQIAAWTFLLLWGMRLNAKLVVFFGAPNISDSVLPDHLRYLSSYFGKRRVTALFPVFITIATAAATALVYTALLFPAGSFMATGLWLIAALACLAVLEHWALVLPIRDTALWGWALKRPSTLEQKKQKSHAMAGETDGL